MKATKRPSSDMAGPELLSITFRACRADADTGRFPGLAIVYEDIVLTIRIVGDEYRGIGTEGDIASITGQCAPILNISIRSAHLSAGGVHADTGGLAGQTVMHENVDTVHSCRWARGWRRTS